MTSYPLIALLTLSSSSQGAVLVNLNFNSLPSSQGFTYSNAGPHADDAETTVFSTTGTALIQETVGLGQGSNTPGNASYRRELTSAETTGVTNFRFELTARVTDHQNTRQDFSYAAFTNNIYFNDEGFFFGIKPNELHINGTYFTPAGFDGSENHNYQIDVDLVASTFEFFLDDVSVLTGTTRSFANTNLILFGDGTGTGNTNGERSRFVVTTNVPEPGSALLALLGCSFIFCRRR